MFASPANVGRGVRPKKGHRLHGAILFALSAPVFIIGAMIAWNIAYGGALDTLDYSTPGSAVGGAAGLAFGFVFGLVILLYGFAGTVISLVLFFKKPS